jgi:lysylphosphatidylglycerol synthetase-like protein (DUF2156 family)
MRHYTVDGIDGVIAYQPAGRSTIVQLGGVFAAPQDQDALLTAFLNFVAERRRRVVAVQLTKSDAVLYASRGFRVNQFGADYARPLADFDLRGKKHMQLRNKISRARRAEITVAEEPLEATGPALDEIDRLWLGAKGRHVKELTFMVGQRGGPAQRSRRLFLARCASGKALAYVSFSPVYGPRAGWLHDLSRRRPDAPPGVLELIVVTAVEKFRSEQENHLHFGFTPFTSLDPAMEVGPASPVTARILRFLSRHGSAIYPAADQLAYKEKWGLDLVEPEYIAFQGDISLRAVWDLLRLTNAA